VRSYKSDGRKASLAEQEEKRASPSKKKSEPCRARRKASLAEQEEKRALPSKKKSEPCRAQKINGRISVSRQRPFYQATN
jgi:hypothetical protein